MAVHGERRMKIRESCNSCSSQKIRCSKERPRCQRCQNKGLDCSYSFSQRTGRRASSAAFSTSTSNPRNARIAPPMKDADASVHIRSNSLPDDQSFTPSMSSMMMHGNGDAFAFDGTLSGYSDADIFQDLSSAMPMDLLWSPTTEDLSSLGNSASNSASTSLSQDFNILSAPSYSATNGEWQSLQTTSAPPDISTATSPSFSHGAVTQQSASTGQSHSKQLHHGSDCMTLALQIVLDLHIEREVCKTASSDPLSYMQPMKEEIRDVDTVLFRNRDAIKSINKILDCNCSSDQGVVLACYMAACKVVAWYGAAIGISDVQNDNTLGDGGQSAMSDRIVARPIFMGRYCLDAEAQRSVRAKVVLTELREHIQPLLLRLPKHSVSGVSRSEQGNTGSSSSSSKENDGQTCILRNQLRRIIREANNINKCV